MAASSPPPLRFPRQQSGPAPVRILGQRRTPWDDLYHFILTVPWWQFFLLATVAFVALNLLFATVYALAPGAISNTHGSFEQLFYFSVQTLATIGYGTMAPETRFGHIVVAVEALTGILSVALITGITFAKFSRPKARVLFARKAVVAPRNGVPHLMFRMANWRHNQVVEAQLKVSLLVMERTREGEVGRRAIDLLLLRDRTALFFLTWTAMHRIDEESPLYGEGARERLRAAGATFYLSFYGLDETIAQTIYARHYYGLDDIEWNARFADVMSQAPDGANVIDYHRFHEVIPVPVTEPTGPQ